MSDTEGFEREHCDYCGGFLARVPVVWKTEYGDIEAEALECHNPRCPETKSREKRKIVSIITSAKRTVEE